MRAVGDGGAALAAATQLIPDVARRIKETGTDIAVVFLTACLDIDTFHAAKESGFLA